MLYNAANEKKKLLLIEKAGHNDVWETGGTIYKNSVSTFFTKYLD
jgi:fermentation-respiration switch protein FrsA (DUF1100 family)